MTEFNAGLADETITVQAPVTVSLQQLADNFCAALEGGSTYWCEGFEPDRYVEDYSWGHEQVALCVPFEIVYEDGEILHVDNSKERMTRTLELMAADYPKLFGEVASDTGDAETGDVLFQLLCFGEVVYG